jgi:hypothetical protein
MLSLPRSFIVSFMNSGTQSAYGHGYSARCCSGLQPIHHTALCVMELPSQLHLRTSPSLNTLIQPHPIAVTRSAPVVVSTAFRMLGRFSCPRTSISQRLHRKRPVPPSPRAPQYSVRHASSAPSSPFPAFSRIESALDLETSYAYNRFRLGRGAAADD